MAKYDLVPPFTGTIGRFCIYKMCDRYYLRMASSLTRERVLTDPRFRKTMEYACLLARASHIGSIIYQQLPAYRKVHRFYRRLTGEAMYWLKYEWKEADIIELLQQRYVDRPYRRDVTEQHELPVVYNVKRNKQTDIRTVRKILRRRGIWRDKPEVNNEEGRKIRKLRR